MGLSQRPDAGPCCSQETSRVTRSADRHAVVHRNRCHGEPVVCLHLPTAVPLHPGLHGGRAGWIRFLRHLSSHSSSLPFQESTVSKTESPPLHSSSIPGHKLRSHKSSLGSCFRYNVSERTQKDGARQWNAFDCRRVQARSEEHT